MPTCVIPINKFLTDASSGLSDRLKNTDVSLPILQWWWSCQVWDDHCIL